MPMIALEIPEEWGMKLDKLPIPGEKVDIGSHHITLVHMADKLSTDEVSTLTDAILQAIEETGQRKIDIEISEITSFPPGKDGTPVIIPVHCEELNNFREKLIQNLEKNDIEYSKKHPEYKAHITLSYCDLEKYSNSFKKPLKITLDNISYHDGYADENGVIMFFELE